MKRTHKSIVRRVWLLALLSITAVLTLSSQALAFGTVNFKKTTVEELDGKWKIEMDINYGSEPHMGHIPFDFVLTQTTYFENSITDADKEPQIRRKPMVNQTPQRESVDIDFSDAKGKLWPRTKFQISLRRDRGYSAGEYSLVIRRASDGAQLGNNVKLTLNGRNELIDRRAIVFASGDGGTKKKAAAASSSEADAGEPPEKKTEATDKPSDTPAPAESSEGNAPPPVEKRPGSHGCGCTLPGDAESDIAASFTAAIGLIAFGIGRRRLRMVRTTHEHRRHHTKD